MKLYLLLIVMCFIFSGWAQNLIPNGSFEERSDCPTSADQLYLAKNWFKIVNSSVDYFHLCAQSVVSIPKNFNGFQYSRTDSAYIGFALYANTINNAREYAGVELTDSLESGNYKLTLYLSLANNCQYAVSNFGIFFSESKPNDCNIFNSAMDCLSPQIVNSSHIYFDDTLGWQKFSGVFKAKGGEKFITIGNFDLDENVNSYLFNPNAIYNISAYYLDDVSLVQLQDYYDISLDVLSFGTMCYSDSNSIFLRFQNTGSKALDFTVDTVTFTTEVIVDGLVVQTNETKLSTNLYNPTPNVPLETDSFMSFEIFPVDLSRSGEVHQLRVTSSFTRDEDNTNNYVSAEITPNIDVGDVTISPEIICAGDTVTLQAQNYIGEPLWQYSTDGLSWQALSTAATTFHNPSVSTYYRLQICGQIHSGSILVHVPTEYEGNVIVSPTSICAGDTVKLITKNYTGQPMWEYSTNGIDWLALSSSDTAIHIPTERTYYRAIICDKLYSDTVLVELPDKYTGSVSASTISLCYGDTVFLETKNFTGKPMWEFSINGVDWQNLSSGSTASHQPTESTFYRVEVCEGIYSDSILVKVPEIPLLPTFTLSTCSSGNYVLQPILSNGIENLYWYRDSNSLFPFHTGQSYSSYFNKSRIFYVQSIMDSCVSPIKTAVHLIMENCPLHIPNIFTPNGDGVNDTFYFHNAANKKLHTRIFNRWGNEVAAWEGNVGWDAKELPDGVYYFLVKEQAGEEVIVHKGKVTVLR